MHVTDPTMASTDTEADALFPPEVWANITQHLDVRELGRLYVGSNHAIQERLHAGVTHVVDWCDVPFKTGRHYYSPVRTIPASFLRRFKYLQQLHLPYNTNLVDADLMELQKHLKYLDLSCNELITDFGLVSLPPWLETLNLKFSTNITDQGLSFLPKTLKHLDLDRCKNITDEGLRSLQSSSLVSLKLTFAKNITDEGVLYLPRTLTTLQLAMNKGITPVGVRLLPQSLEILDLSHNANLAHTRRQDYPPRLKLLLLL